MPIHVGIVPGGSATAQVTVAFAGTAGAGWSEGGMALTWKDRHLGMDAASKSMFIRCIYHQAHWGKAVASLHQE